MPTRIKNEDKIHIFENIIASDTVEWPSFSKSIPISDIFYEQIAMDHESIFTLILSRPDVRTDTQNAIGAVERQRPEAFAAFYRDICDAYYSAPAVVAKVAELAEAGPKDALLHFDRSLLDPVIEKSAGRGRY
jgi:hypothetical protein